jgi:hypothetical protein
MRTSELTGAALDWAVAKCEDPSWETNEFQLYREWHLENWKPSTDWAQGGPIIAREGIDVLSYADYPRWQAFTPAPEQPSGQAVCNGPTPLIAAMRCYVASKLGEDVSIPEELAK